MKKPTRQSIKRRYYHGGKAAADLEPGSFRSPRKLSRREYWKRLRRDTKRWK